MPKDTVNWEDINTWKRLMASIVASGHKIDLNKSATYFGTTYSTLENRFRKVKKDAEALEAEVNGGAAPATPGGKKSTTASTPKSKSPAKKDPLHSTATGRVSKTSKKKGAIKQEEVDEEPQAVQEDGVED